MPPQSQTKIPLSSMARGIERRTSLARKNQAVEGFDVIADDGDVRRRDAFNSIATAPPLLLPAGVCYLGVDRLEGAGFTLITDRAGIIMNGGNACWAVYFGVGDPTSATYPDLNEQFDGVLFELVTSSGAIASYRYIRMEYWNGAAWVAMPWWHDTTSEFLGTRSQPLSKDGMIAWHTADFASTWQYRSLGGQDAFWVRARFVDVNGVNAAMLGTSIVTAAPGPRAFHLEAVNGLFPVRIENRYSMVVCADRVVRRGLEKGSAIGCKDQWFEQTKRLWFAIEEEAGFYSDITWPSWFRGAVSLGTGGAGGFTANRITKTRSRYYDPATRTTKPFNWGVDQFRGALLLRNIQLTAPDSRSGTMNPALSGPDRMLEHCRLLVRTAAGGATPVGDLREIIFSNTSNLIIWYDPYGGGAPGGAARFDILGPPLFVYTDPGGRVFEIGSNAAQNLDMVSRAFCRSDDTTVLVGWSGMARIVQEPRWVFDSGDRYTGVVDPVTGRLIITNGAELMDTDGKMIRILKAEFSSDLALVYGGGLADVETKDAETNPLAIALSSFRRAPPRAKYVTSHQNRIFIAGIQGRPFDVCWTAPGGANVLWPFSFSAMIRDSEQHPISGMATLRDKLLVFTPTSIHEASGPNDQGIFYFNPLSVGVGFVHQNAVAKVVGADTSMLVGVSLDGIYAIGGGEPRQVLPEWSQLIPEGINVARLHLAVAVAFPEKNQCLFAVAGAGSSVNNYVLVWDYAADTWWAWRMRWGVSAMAIDRDSMNSAMLLVGTEDGFVQTLVDAHLEDGQFVDGFSVSTPFVSKGDEISPIRAMLTVKNQGQNQTTEFQLMLNQKTQSPHQDTSFQADQGGMVWGEHDWVNAPSQEITRRWTEGEWLIVEIGVPRGTRAYAVAYRIGGTNRWSLREASVIVAPKRDRGRR